MEEVSEDKEFGLIILLITDIINEGSELIFAGKNQWIISKAFTLSRTETQFISRDLYQERNRWFRI
jgi:manganese-dependent inorganic pyrophosphatase